MTSPPDAVLAAFGVTAAPVRLPGGKGTTWRAGDVILKPVEFLPETLWRATVLSELPPSPAFRVARPIPTYVGTWVSGGWEAHRFVAGEPDPTRADDVLRAGVAFHAAVAHLPRPPFLDVRADPWTYGDRVAWGEVPAGPAPALLAPLLAARRPVGLAAQVVHGDLGGNVLFADGLPPAVIDWPVYWRPAAWASAVVVADALCWSGAGPDLPARWAHLPEWRQMLIRALIYRIVTDDRAFGPAVWTPGHVAAYRAAITVVSR